MICLCVASGSLIFFTFDISATFLICTGKEERLRWHNANFGGYLGQRSFLCSNFLGHFQVEGWTSWFWESACTHLKRNSSSREPKYWRQSFQIFKNVHILNLHFFLTIFPIFLLNIFFKVTRVASLWEFSTGNAKGIPFLSRIYPLFNVQFPSLKTRWS